MASLRSDTVHRHLQTLSEEGAVGTLTDGELLERFISGREESAEVAFSTLAFHKAKLAIVSLLGVAAIATGAMVALRPGSAKAVPFFQEIARRPVTSPAEREVAQPAIASTTIKLGGRILNPDGPPHPGARLWLAFQGSDWTWSTRRPQVRATAGCDGRFDPTVSDSGPEVRLALRMTSGMPDGFGPIHVVATADGFGPCWTGLAGAKGDVELRLVKDDVPIEGRLVSLEGRLLAGVEVRTLMVEDPSNPEIIFGAPSGYFRAATTDADGRFHLTGIGRGRRSVIGIAGPGIQRDGVRKLMAKTEARSKSGSIGRPQAPGACSTRPGSRPRGSRFSYWA